MKKNVQEMPIEKTEFGPGKTPLYYSNVGLFSDPFLEDRLPNLEEYYKHPSTKFLNDYWNIDESNSHKFNRAFQEIMDLWNDLDQNVSKFCNNEEQLRNKWIDKIFETLGWTVDVEVASSQHGITNFPDYVLFASKEDWKKSKDLTGAHKFKKAIAVADAKDWGVSLDGKGLTNKNPSFQIVNYLKQTDKNWGILTDGKYWRIYSLKSESKHTTYYEIDLEKILATGDYERFKYFYNFFRVEAFTLDLKLNDRAFLDFVFEDGKFYSQRVEKNLNDRVYKVVDSICQGFLTNFKNPNEQNLKEVYEYSMYYLFKLMFVLNCESKGLLEVNKQDDYYEYSLRKKCFDIKEQFEEGKTWSKQPATYNYISTLYKLLKEGDKSIGVHGFGKEPFEIGSQKFYSENQINDEHLNNALLELACDRDEENNLQFIDYKILSPDHIGSLFEGLLEFNLVATDKKIELVNTKGDRKSSGSYYTPEFLVDFVIDDTLCELVENKNPSEILKLKILDPAMGSGHFLLGVIKYLENKIVQIQDTDKKIAGAIEFDKIRKVLLSNCIFGVDINPLAVQLARFSLWIYTSQKGDVVDPLLEHMLCLDTLLTDNQGLPENIDVIVGNPPWLSKEKNLFTKDEVSYLEMHYKSFEGYKKNLFSLFLEKACSLTQKNGTINFILPNRLMDTPSYQITREIFFKQFKNIKITKLPEGSFKDVTASYISLRLSNAAKDKGINVFEIKEIGQTKSELSYKILSNELGSEYKINLNKDNSITDFISTMKSSCFNLVDYFHCHVGMMIKNNKEEFTDVKSSKKSVKIVKGHCLGKLQLKKVYYFNPSGVTIFGGTKKQEKHEYTPKLLVRKTGDYILSSIDLGPEPVYAEQSVYLVIPKNKMDEKTISIINIYLNTSLPTKFFRSELITNPDSYPYIQQYDLQNIPVPKFLFEDNKFVAKLYDWVQKSKKSDDEIISHIEIEISNKLGLGVAEKVAA
ncbi:MAG: N-6 DNA methylase [Bacteriovoracaceae bacterium]|nr:N-6 DNA methylase [Bacteriovoracaceae bacterium]